MASKLNRILKWLPLVWLTRKTFENLLKFVRNKRIDLITFLLSRPLTWKGAARSKDERSWSKGVRKLASHVSLSLWILLRAKFARSYQKARHFLVTASRNSEGLETSNFSQFQSIIARFFPPYFRTLGESSPWILNQSDYVSGHRSKIFAESSRLFPRLHSST